MLVIRKDQIAALAKDRARSLPQRIASYLATEAAAQAQALGPAGLAALVTAASSRARSHELSIEWDVCRFCLLALLHGEDFEELDWAKEILVDHGWSPTERVDLLWQCHFERRA